MGLTFNNGRNAAAMTSTSSLNVGIGTASPSNTYQGLTIYGSNPSLSLQTSSAGGWTWTEYRNSAGTNNFSMGVNQSIPQFVIKAGAGLDSPNFIMSSAGNVGIGITPTQRFQVYSTASTTSSIFETNSANSYIALKSTSGTNYIGNVSSAMTFEAGGSERMRINSTGNVSIGSTDSTWNLSLSNRLQIQNSLLIGYSTTGTFLTQNLNYNSTWKYISTGTASIYSQDTGLHVFYTSTSGTAGAAATLNERMRISNAGNVGINGTPTSYLTNVYFDVIGNSTSQGGLIQSRNSDNSIIGSFFTNVNGLNIRTETSHSMLFSTAATERMRISSAGNVGIGTSSPVYPLVVKVGTNRNWAISASGSGFASFRAGDDGYNNFNRGEIDALPLLLNSQSGGNVLIGTTNNLGAKLYVDGVIYANGAGGFASATYVAGARNPIWRFGNADAYGISYFQGTAGYGGNDVIGFHFGGSTTTSAGSAFQFIQNGNYIFAGSPISDRRAKENINDITFNATEKVMALQSRSYYMKEGNNKIKYGFIAQEVYEVLPDLISGDLEKDSIVGLDYNGLIPVLVKSIQELEARIKTLENK